MKERIVKNKWEYEVREIENEYGFRIDIYLNDKLNNSQGGFGSINNAIRYAEDRFLLIELGMERSN